MTVETIGEAWQLGWRITAPCASGKRDGMNSVRPCIYSYYLDLSTPVWDTRGTVSAVRFGDASEMPELRIMAGCTDLSPPKGAAGGKSEEGRLDAQLRHLAAVHHGSPRLHG